MRQAPEPRGPRLRRPPLRRPTLLPHSGPSRLITFLALAALATSAGASSLIVPDDVPTVQAALDARVDTVLVRAGRYPETPIVVANVRLAGIPGDPAFERPVLEGLPCALQGDYSSDPDILVRGLEFTSPVSFTSDVVRCRITLEDCFLKAGTTAYCDVPGVLQVTLRRCRLQGNVGLYAHGTYVVDSCVVEGQIRAQGADTHLVVTNSTIRGPGIHGAIFNDGEIAAATIVGNVIEGHYHGVFLEAVGEVRIEDNLIRDCRGGGIHLRAPVGRVLHNRVERCGGDGIAAGPETALLVEGNTIARCGGSGMALTAPATITGNLVWGCGRNGIELNEGYADLEVRNNTIALNAGAGIVSVDLSDPGDRRELVGNIAYANGGYGIQWGFGPPILMRCNDWFANASGDVRGLPASSEDFSVDPRFCGAESGDLRLAADSPLVNPPGCGPVGAVGVGCSGASRLALMGANPSRGPVQIEFELRERAAIQLDVFDVQGRLVASLARGVWPAGRHTVEWSGLAGNARLPGGLYLVRYRYPGGEDKRRVVRTP